MGSNLKNIEKIRKAPKVIIFKNAWEPSKQIQRESKYLTKKYCNHKQFEIYV